MTRRILGLKQSIILVLMLFFGTAAKAQNYSLSFDGVDDYANIVELSTAIDNSSITLMGWFKSTSNGEPNIYYEGVFGFRNYPSSNGNYFAAMNWTGYSEPTIACYGGADASFPLTPNDDEWYHLALVYDNTNAVFSTYLDGIQMASNTAANDPIVPSIDLLIGNNIENGNHFFQGYIDDVSLWSVALSQENIQSYLSSELNGNETGLVGYWNFNEGTGTTAYDATSNGNDGTINGATWSTDVPSEINPAINVTSPNGGETWELGSTNEITWTSSYVSGNVKIELYQNGSAYQIIEGSTDNDGSYSWEISSALEAGTDYRVRISSMSNTSVYDESNAVFTISSAQRYSLAFSGDDYIEFPDDNGTGVFDNLDFNAEFSIQFLIKITSNYDTYIINKTPLTGLGGYGIRFRNNSQSGMPEIYSYLVGNDGWSCSGVFQFNSGTLEDYLNTWLSVTVVHSNSFDFLKTYVNGIPTDNTNNGNAGGCGTISITNNDNSMYIGSEGNYNSVNFLVNRVVTWRRALSTADVLGNLNLDMIDNAQALSMNTYWSMDEGSGNIVYDGLHGNASNPNNYNGTIYGAEWSDDVPIGW